MAGFLLIRGGRYLVYCEIRKVLPAVWALWRLPALCDVLCRAVNTQTEAMGLMKTQAGCCPC